MMRAIFVGRRRFLTAAGLTLAALGLGRLGSLVMPAHETTLVTEIGRRIVALIGCPESARAVGREYLRHRPREADVRLLVNFVIGDEIPDDARGLMADREVLRHAVRAECQRDFEKGELVAIGGWYLARSEARMCGLAYLL